MKGICLYEAYKIEITPVYEPDVIFGFPRYVGQRARWTTADGVRHEKIVSPNSSVLNALRLH